MSLFKTNGDVLVQFVDCPSGDGNCKGKRKGYGGRKEGKIKKVRFQVKRWQGHEVKLEELLAMLPVLGRIEWPSLLKQGFSATRTIRSVRITNARRKT